MHSQLVWDVHLIISLCTCAVRVCMCIWTCTKQAENQGYPNIPYLEPFEPIIRLKVFLVVLIELWNLHACLFFASSCQFLWHCRRVTQFTSCIMFFFFIWQQNNFFFFCVFFTFSPQELKLFFCSSFKHHSWHPSTINAFLLFEKKYPLILVLFIANARLSTGSCVLYPALPDKRSKYICVGKSCYRLSLNHCVLSSFLFFKSYICVV